MRRCGAESSSAAAMTYVAATPMANLQLLYF
jgi:Zn-dependent membrane protease YugP